MLRPNRHQRGFSLVELLIGITVGLILIGGALTFFVSTTRHQGDMVDAAQFEQEMRQIMLLVANDVRRAGYAGAIPNSDANQDGTLDVADMVFNPFAAAENDLAVAAMTGEAANSCVTFAYNLDEDSPPAVGACAGCGSLPASYQTSAPYSDANLPYDRDNLEMFGFRLNGGRVETRNGIGGSDTSFDCNSGTWVPLTAPNIQITALSFGVTLTQVEVDQGEIADGSDDAGCDAGNPCLCTREVAISLAGNLAADAFIARSLAETVRVPNDKFIRSFDPSNPCVE